MVSVTYQAPASIQDAVSLLAGADMPAAVLSGGTDLLIKMQSMVGESHLFVDAKNIPGMTSYEITADGLRLGPCMSCADLTARADIRAMVPGLVEAAYLIGSTQVQGRASVGGNLCNASPAADTIPALIVTSAQCVIAGPNGERTVATEDFVTGVGRNCLEKGEMLIRLDIPTPAPHTADAYLRFIPRTEMDIAVAGAGVSVTLDDSGTCIAARVAIGAVAVTALLVPDAAAALVGTKLDEAALDAAAAAVTALAAPITDRRGTVEFRKHVVGVLTKRAARIAADRAKEK